MSRSHPYLSDTWPCPFKPFSIELTHYHLAPQITIERHDVTITSLSHRYLAPSNPSASSLPTLRCTLAHISQLHSSTTAQSAASSTHHQTHLKPFIPSQCTAITTVHPPSRISPQPTLPHNQPKSLIFAISTKCYPEIDSSKYGWVAMYLRILTKAECGRVAVPHFGRFLRRVAV